TVSEDGACPGASDATVADLVFHDSSDPYHNGNCTHVHFDVWLDHVHTKAKEPGSQLSLIAFDTETSAATADHMAAIIAAVRAHLTYDLPNLSVIYSVGSLDDAKAAFTYDSVEPGTLLDNEALQVDGESD